MSQETIHSTPRPAPALVVKPFVQQSLLETRDAIIAANQADLETLILNYPGYELEGVSYIQARVRGIEGSDSERLIAWTRWKILHTMMHEMLHSVRHPGFSEAMQNVEENRDATEGFAEYFAAHVHTWVRERALANPLDSIRMDIEGALVPEFEIPVYDGTTGTYAGARLLVPIAAGEPDPALEGRAAPQGIGGMFGLDISYEF